VRQDSPAKGKIGTATRQKFVEGSPGKLTGLPSSNGAFSKIQIPRNRFGNLEKRKIAITPHEEAPIVPIKCVGVGIEFIAGETK
jgi:hypothetical protein